MLLRGKRTAGRRIPLGLDEGMLRRMGGRSLCCGADVEREIKGVFLLILPKLGINQIVRSF
jgi:hypothetical protein